MSARLPSQALDCQLDLAHYYLSTDFGQRYTAAVVQAISGDDNPLDESYRSLGRTLHARALVEAEVYAVDSEILDVLDAAYKTVPDYELHEEDIPSQTGFVYFERPLLYSDTKDADLVVEAFSWIPVVSDETGDTYLMFMLFTNPRDKRDHLYAKWDELERNTYRIYGVNPPRLISMTGGIWDFGKPPKTDVARFALAFFRFVQESWIDAGPVKPDRAAVRRAQREGKTLPSVRVVRLRRRRNPTDPDHTPSKVEWSHRWLVRGHWRNQWYPSLQQHRPVWIGEHLKGPDDKPLVAHDKIFHVVR